MTPRMVLIVREDGSLQATCGCGGMDEIVPSHLVGSFMLNDAAEHVTGHSVMERRGRGRRW